MIDLLGWLDTRMKNFWAKMIDDDDIFWPAYYVCGGEGWV